MSVFKHQGKWMYQFKKNGVRHQKSGFQTKDEALIAQAKSRKGIVKIDTDFAQLCEKRLSDVEARRTDKYYKENLKLIENLQIRWEGKKKITRADIETYLQERIKISAYSANKELRFIKALFNHGIELNLIEENPAQRIKFYGVNKNLKYIPAQKDVEKVLSIVNDEQRKYLLTIINTLARINEINNLDWKDVFDDYLILRTRKSKNSNEVSRKIPFNKTLKEIVKDRKEGRVFTYRGEPIGYRSKFLKNACRKAKVKVFTYHCLRHYGASTLANAGIALTDIQIILGHQRTTTTDIYLQSIRNGVKKALDILG